MSSGSVNNGGTKPSINASVNIKSNGIVNTEMTMFLNKSLSIKPLHKNLLGLLLDLESTVLSDYFNTNDSVGTVTESVEIPIFDYTIGSGFGPSLISPTVIEISEYGILPDDTNNSILYKYVVYNGSYYVLEQSGVVNNLYSLYDTEYDNNNNSLFNLSEYPIAIDATFKNDEILGEYLIMFPKKIGCDISTDSIFFNYKDPRAPPGYGLQNTNISFIGADKISLMYLDGVTGEWSEPIYMSYDGDTDTIIGTGNDLSFSIYYFPQEAANELFGRSESSCYYLNHMFINIKNETTNRTIYICDIVICIENQSIINPCKVGKGCEKINVKINELKNDSELISFIKTALGDNSELQIIDGTQSSPNNV